MLKLTENDSNILDFFNRKGIRYKNPIQLMPLMDNLQKHYHMSRDEICVSLQYLEEQNIIEGNGTIISLTEQYDKKVYEKRSIIMKRQYTISEKKAARFKMLERIYKESGGSENSIFEIYGIGEELNFPTDLIDITADYLQGENLIKSRTIGGGYAITHNGIVQYEKAISAPEMETEYFLPVNVTNNINFFGNVENSQLQTGATNQNQTMNRNDNFNELRLWLMKLENALNNEKLYEIMEQIKDDVDLIKENVSSEKPNTKYIGIALRAIEGVLIGLTSNTIFHVLLKELQRLLP